MQRVLLLVFAFFTLNIAWNQTLIMNEVSQGITGNMEYVEFVVVDTSVNYNCGLTTPPCIDIRGWIFDDNSGYHGASGVASGCIRFSFDPLWSCVPMGTIILIYNDADPDPGIPANDLSLVDGNCNIVAPISDATLFESNVTTPGAVACSYPAAGWTPGGNWSNTLLANGGDCARIVDLGGCEVFSVCWGTANASTLIYFSGSAANRVYYFNDTDPANQLNWTSGCTDDETILDANTCGSNDQTPGAPNNPLNDAYISQFNNGCMPITPVIASAVVDNDENCGCDGQATASASGSIPGYTYEWYDDTYTPIGQSTATASGLCAGNYHCIVTSSIDCEDTVDITIAPSVPLILVVTDPPANCVPSTVDITDPAVTAGSDPGTLTYWSDEFATVAIASPFAVTDSGTYYIQLESGGCFIVQPVNVIINSQPNLIISDPSGVCSPLTVDITDPNVTLGSDMGTLTYWNDTLATSPLADPAAIGAVGTYFIQLEDANSCTSIQPVTITIYNLPNLMITDPEAVCAPSGVDLTSAAITAGSDDGISTYWNDEGTTSAIMNPTNVTTNGTYFIQLEDANSCLTIDSVHVTINASPNLVIINPEPVCPSQTIDITDAAVTLGSDPGTLTYWNDTLASSVLSNPNSINTGATYYIQLEDANMCTSILPVIVSFYADPVLIITNPLAVCFPSTVDIKDVAVTNGSDAGVLTYWSDTAATQVLANADALNNSGVYYIQLEDANSCTTVQEVSVVINSVDEALFTLTPTCDGATAEITGDPGTFAFSTPPADAATIDSSSGTIIGGTFNSTYSVVLTTNGVCPANDTDTVTVSDCTPEPLADIVIPTAFTPENSPNNTWLIQNMDEVYPNNIVTIYNRWGNVIYCHVSDPSNPYSLNPWNGTYEGKPLPVASYYYIVEFNDGSGESVKGTVTIVRN